ncbi:NAD(P)/FAD-dependent oxidoreductase, partial [Actinophytocola sp. S1-96]|nr:NAD(P)/FAD-dependent oxidoreductase [Actinophytocola gossypii]
PPDRLQRHADLIEQVIDQRAPGFRDRILARTIHGPHELETHDPSLVDGAINAGTAAIHQQLFLRPVPGLGRADTPIDHLYLASASAHPGGAVHGAPGNNAAHTALTRHRFTGPAYRATINTAHRALYR